jgi:hypothetical protein
VAVDPAIKGDLDFLQSRSTGADDPELVGHRVWL